MCFFISKYVQNKRFIKEWKQNEQRKTMRFFLFLKNKKNKWFLFNEIVRSSSICYPIQLLITKLADKWPILLCQFMSSFWNNAIFWCLKMHFKDKNTQKNPSTDTQQSLKYLKIRNHQKMWLVFQELIAKNHWNSVNKNCPILKIDRHDAMLMMTRWLNLMVD